MKRCFSHSFIAFTFYTVGMVSAQAQDNVMPINIETVLKLSGSNNLEIAEVTARYELAKAKQAEAKEWILPSLNPGINLTSYNGTIQDVVGVFVDVDKNSFWAGINITADWNLGDGIYNQLASKQYLELAGHEKSIIEAQATLKAIRIFYNLGAAQSKLLALEKLVSKSDDILKQLTLQVEQGITYKSDLLLAQANHNHLRIEYSKARSEMKLHSHELLQHLNIAEDAQLLVTDSVLIPVALVDTNNVELAAAYEKRPEMLLYKSKIAGLELEQKTQTTGILLPNFDFELNNGPLGPYFSPDGNAMYYYFGAKWNVPLGALVFGGVKKQFDAKIKIAEVQSTHAKNIIRREIWDEESHVHAADLRMKLAKSALGYAEEAFDQSTQRQALGTAIPLEVLRAQEQVLEANLDLIDAITLYNQAQYALYIALGNKL